MKILYFAVLRQFLGKDEEHVEISGETTIGEFIKEHLAPRLEGRDPSRLIYAVNEELATMETTITNSDTIAVFSPFSGG